MPVITVSSRGGRCSRRYGARRSPQNVFFLEKQWTGKQYKNLRGSYRPSPSSEANFDTLPSHIPQQIDERMGTSVSSKNLPARDRPPHGRTLNEGNKFQKGV